MQIKIRLYGMHIGYINSEYLNEFQREYRILNINSWIKEMCYKEWGIYLEDKDSIEKLKEVLNENYYENISEWIKEKIRNELLKNKLSKMKK